MIEKEETAVKIKMKILKVEEGLCCITVYRTQGDPAYFLQVFAQIQNFIIDEN